MLNQFTSPWLWQAALTLPVAPTDARFGAGRYRAEAVRVTCCSANASRDISPAIKIKQDEGSGQRLRPRVVFSE